MSKILNIKNSLKLDRKNKFSFLLASSQLSQTLGVNNFPAEEIKHPEKAAMTIHKKNNLHIEHETEEEEEKKSTLIPLNWPMILSISVGVLLVAFFEFKIVEIISSNSANVPSQELQTIKSEELSKKNN